jgi:tetratricopeptide (TPR) repeat protein
MLASPALYLPGLVALDAGWSRHFLRRGISHFNGGEYIYALEDFDSALAHSPNAGTAAFAHMYKGRALFALKNYAKARAEFETAFATSPEAGLIYAAAGSSAFGASRFAEALEFFQRGLKAAPHHDLLLNNFAWFRATCPDAAFRNGAEAVRFAREACERASWKDSVFMDTLAAAQAEAGHFAEAVNTEGRALADKDAERLEKSPAELRLRQFSQHQPYRAKQGR